MADELRIVLLGKTGDGISSAGNTILGGDFFEVKCSPESTTQKCTVQSNKVNDRLISIIDTPGFFNTCLKEDELNHEIMRCMTECAPGPHAFVIVLRLGGYNDQEIVVVQKFLGEEAFRYAIILFTFGAEGIDANEYNIIEKVVATNGELKKLVEKCGGRCHVIDNKYWAEAQAGYMSNKTQVEELLKTVDKMVAINGGSCYTNSVLQVVDEEINEETAQLQKNENKGEKENRQQAKENVLKNILAGMTGAIYGALFGLAITFVTPNPALIIIKIVEEARDAIQVAKNEETIKSALYEVMKNIKVKLN
ncbi:GTPase IMAP family member 7-like [Sardina pilchardus]|uniref:GTPase IMAP family member 7-like n=1 Tax=Sardina pilchardus TaxID=27697 RepID=UPI002E0F2007